MSCPYWCVGGCPCPCVCVCARFIVCVCVSGVCLYVHVLVCCVFMCLKMCGHASVCVSVCMSPQTLSVRHSVVALPFCLPHDQLRWAFMMYSGNGSVQTNSLPRLHQFSPHLAHMRDPRGKLQYFHVDTGVVSAAPNLGLHAASVASLPSSDTGSAPTAPPGVWCVCVCWYGCVYVVHVCMCHVPCPHVLCACVCVRV